MRAFHLVKLEFGYTAVEDAQVAPGQQPNPTTIQNATFFGRSSSLENAINDAKQQLNDHLAKLVAEAGPRMVQ